MSATSFILAALAFFMLRLIARVDKLEVDAANASSKLDKAVGKLETIVRMLEARHGGKIEGGGD
jgi:hypothetical protein